MGRSLAPLLLAAGLALASSAAMAVQPSERLSDPALEARARALSTEIRCMVCQNQSIDDSDAQLAKDLRVLVRERITAGDSDSAVLDYLVARYGEFVLLKPRLEGGTLVLWLAGPALLVAGIVGAVFAHRSRRRSAKPADGVLTADEEARLAILVKDGEIRAKP